ncbi:MAG TPA: hypothetical protein VKA63_00235 [Candidatus Krumholzibacteria bacterium]|nr:hypothetical protein [Candidatus Krumholzibacteria bacterium]
MFRRVLNPILALLTLLLFLFSGCGSSSTGPGDASNPSLFTGYWNVSGTVISKQSCDNGVGDTLEWGFIMGQNGSRGALLLNGGGAKELLINGSTATASWSEDGGQIDLELTLSGDKLQGTLTNTNALRSCTEVISLSGTRMDLQPLPEFAGPWDLQTTVTNSTCNGIPIGVMEDLCRTIAVSGGSISVDDPDGAIVGIGDGNSATLFRTTDSEILVVDLTLGLGGLAGTATTLLFDGDCTITQSIAGVARTEACPPPPTPNDFAGAWYVGINQFSQLGCSVESSLSYIGECIGVSVNGSTVTVDDGTGQEPLTGSIDGSTATVSRVDSDGEYTMTLQVAGDQLTGHASKTFTSGSCNGSSFDIDFEGPRLPSPCSAAGGNFAGDWSLAFTTTYDGCQLNPASVCAHFYQNGNIVVDEADRFVGTVVGNRVTFHSVEVAPDLDSSYTTDLVLDTDGSSLTGTLRIRIEGISNSSICTTLANVVGTPTTPCMSTRLNAEPTQRRTGFHMIKAGVR